MVIRHRKCRTFVLLGILFSVIFLPARVFALGEFDGVWSGLEDILVPGYIANTETTATIVYQTGTDTLSLWNSVLGIVETVQSGNQWILSAPLETTYLGNTVSISSLSITFSSSGSMTGTIEAKVKDSTGIISLSQTKQSCQRLTQGETVTGLSGAKDSVRCFEIILPPESTNMDIQTSSGTGDCDLFQVLQSTGFENYSSVNNWTAEQISVQSPGTGKWYIGLQGAEDFSDVSLTASYDGLPASVPNFAADQLTGIAPLTVTFSDQSTGSITSWVWDFGDGTTSTVQNPVHIYQTAGLFTVSLTISGPGGTAVESKTGFVEAREVGAQPWVPMLLLNKDE